MKRITISVPDDVADKAQRAVDAGDVPTMSGYFTRLAKREPDWVAARAIVAEMIEEAGGLSEEDYAWARASLGLDAQTSAVA
ncbi:MAG: hypothetical protein FWH11_05230 [Micrococcales bacterium]|nr:hypothetical protein [Micrococcales bacterium]